MQIKRFQAATMADALERVKRELGLDAVILSACSRKNAKGLFAPFKKTGVEVTAAGHGPLPPTEPHRSQADSDKVTINRRPYPAVTRRGARPRLTEGISYSTPHKPVRAPIERITSNRLTARQETDAPNGAKYHALYRRIVDHGVEEGYALEVIAAARLTEDHVGQEPTSPSDPLVDILEKMGVSAQPPVIEGGEPRCIAVVGATGVGKTTAISKLAAAYALDENLRVALISLDNIRVAASDQLQVFSDIIGVPMETVADTAALESALDKFRQHHDLILIDTPGLCFRNADQLHVLADWFETIGQLEVHLLYSATSRLRDNLHLYERLAGIRVDRLMFSKVDETFYYGDILNVLLRLQLPVSFFFDGEAGPDGVKTADLNVLTDFLTAEVNLNSSRYEPGTNRNSRSVQPVPMRWMPLPDEIEASSGSEETAVGDQIPTDRDRSPSRFFRFNGKNKRYTTA